MSMRRRLPNRGVTLVHYLTHTEMRALLDAPDPRTRSGTPIGPCCIWLLPPVCASPNFSDCVVTNSRKRDAVTHGWASPDDPQ